jgi:hypothetical protein
MKTILSVSWISLFWVFPSWAGNYFPICQDQGRALDVNNDQVIQWKTRTANQYTDRAHIKGRVVRDYGIKSNHQHFQIEIQGVEQSLGTTIEVIYNESREFGFIEKPKKGMEVEVCGEYITSNAPSGPYPASPDGALVHWVHKASKGSSHDEGFVILDGVLYGYGKSNQLFENQDGMIQEAIPDDR